MSRMAMAEHSEESGEESCDESDSLKSMSSEAMTEIFEERLETKGWYIVWKPIIVIVLVVLFMVAGKYYEGWHVLTCVYVLMQIVTTIGYGDVTPKSDAMKVFLSVFVLVALAVLATYITEWVQDVVEKSQSKVEDYLGEASEELRHHLSSHLEHHPHIGRHHAEKKRSKQNTSDFHKLGSFNQVLSATAILLCSVIGGAVFFWLVEPCSCSYGVSEIANCTETKGFQACKDTGGSTKSFLDAAYMSVFTVTTIGFGDVSPKSQTGRLFASVWCFVGVAACVSWLASVTKFFYERWTWKRLDLVYLKLDHSAWERMDSSGEGNLSRWEFLQFCLVEQGLVSEDVIKYINEIYDIMDPEMSNAVTYENVHKLQRLQRISTARSWRE